MSTPKRFKRRLMPEEVIDITSDTLHFMDSKLLITSWSSQDMDTEADFNYSWAYLDDGFQIHRKMDKDGNFLYWYIDILAIEYSEQQHAYTLTDLIVDVVVHPDGYVDVIDLDEMAEAMEQGFISQEQVVLALRHLDTVLRLNYAKKFPPPEVERFLSDQPIREEV